MVVLAGETLAPWAQSRGDDIRMSAKWGNDMAVARYSGVWAREGDTFLNAGAGDEQLLPGGGTKLVLRDVQGDAAAIDERLQQIATRGLPNWFGEQRFGRDGGNVPAALAMFGGRRMRKDQRSLLLSAARSALFNRVLAARVEHGSWDQPLQGEVWMLDGSRSVFGPEPYSDVLAERLVRFDIHPSAPLWGEGELRSTDAARELELAALDDDESKALRVGLEEARLKQERRALRLRPALLQHQWLAADVLELSFALPPGCYATAVLHELGPVEDASQV